MSRITQKVEAFFRKSITNLLKVIFANKNVNLPLDISKIDRILILRYDVIGDMAITFPIIDLLRSLNPNLKIDIIASPSNYILIKNDSRISHYEILDRKSIKSFWKITHLLRKQNYDLILALVFNRTTYAGLLANLISNSAYKATIKDHNRTEQYAAYFNIQIDIDMLRGKFRMAEIYQYIIAKVFSIEHIISEFKKSNFADRKLLAIKLELSEDNNSFAENFWEQNKLNGKQAIFYNISAGNESRVLSVEKNIQLIKLINEYYPQYKIILSAAPNETYKTEQINENLANSLIQIPKQAVLLDVCALIPKTKLVISPDTAMIHLASAFHIPTLGLFTNYNSPPEWLPYQSDFECALTNGQVPLNTLEVAYIFEQFKKLEARVSK